VRFDSALQGSRFATLAFKRHRGCRPLAFGIAALVIFSAVAQPSWAQSQASDQKIQFDIPAQPLDSALEAYMQATGLQVLYPSELATSRRSSPVTGQLTSRGAIEMLLSGTDLTIHYTADGAFTVRPLPAAPDHVAAGPRFADYDAFLGRTQQRIIASLCRSLTTRPGSYRAVLQFSIAPAGFIDDASLLGSTGDTARDRAVMDLLRGLTIGQAPPANMPQPVTMLIGPRAPGGSDECRRYVQ
jgi:hypothetical protein